MKLYFFIKSLISTLNCLVICEIGIIVLHASLHVHVIACFGMYVPIYIFFFSISKAAEDSSFQVIEFALLDMHKTSTQ